MEFNYQVRSVVEKAIILFNENPKRGIDLLLKKQTIEADPELIAEFMLTTPGLSKEAKGVYLGKNDPFVKKVLAAYCNKLDFRQMSIDEALRFFLS